MKLAKRLMMRQSGLWTITDTTSTLWLDAADAATITLDGSTVSQWNDKSGNGRHATAASGSRPDRISSGLQFNGSSHFMEIAAHATSVLHTLFVVAEIDSTGSAVILERGTNYNDAHNTIYFGVASSTTFAAFVHHDAYSYTGGTHGGKSTSLCSLCSKYAGANTNFVYRDGTEQSKTITETGSGSDTSASIRTFIGARGGASRFLDAKIREIVLIGSAATDELRQKIDGYLAHKWDSLLGVTTLSDALPAGYPYKSTAPLR